MGIDPPTWNFFATTFGERTRQTYDESRCGLVATQLVVQRWRDIFLMVEYLYWYLL